MSGGTGKAYGIKPNTKHAPPEKGDDPKEDDGDGNEGEDEFLNSIGADADGKLKKTDKQAA